MWQRDSGANRYMARGTKSKARRYQIWYPIGTSDTLSVPKFDTHLYQSIPIGARLVLVGTMRKKRAARTNEHTCCPLPLLLSLTPTSQDPRLRISKVLLTIEKRIMSLRGRRSLMEDVESERGTTASKEDTTWDNESPNIFLCNGKKQKTNSSILPPPQPLLSFMFFSFLPIFLLLWS